jgi:hypothetical protein
MADKDLEVFEKRAQESEKQIAILTKKLEQIEEEQSMHHTISLNECFSIK